MEKMSIKEKIMVIVLVLLIILFSFIVLFVVANKNNDEQVLEVPNYFDDVENYIYIEEIDTSIYTDLYKSINLKRVKFKNVSELLYGEFENKQNEYINTINSNIEDNKKFIEDYNVNNNIVEKITKEEISNINDMIFELNKNVLINN